MTLPVAVPPAPAPREEQGMKNSHALASDYDSPWKEALERYFESFCEFYFPVVHAGIAWERGYEFLDKELQQVVRDAELGRRYADKLVKVSQRVGRYEALHLASAIAGGANLFVTTDDRILKKMSSSQELRVTPPLAALALLESWYDHGN